TCRPSSRPSSRCSAGDAPAPPVGGGRHARRGGAAARVSGVGGVGRRDRVVDAESEDKTVTIAREFTDRVVVRPWPGYAAQKNAALDLATGDWALSLDADEVVSPELRSEIAGVLASDGPADGYAVPRRNIFWGRWVRHGGLYPDWQVRLFRRGRGRFVPRAVHESVSV